MLSGLAVFLTRRGSRHPGFGGLGTAGAGFGGLFFVALFGHLLTVAAAFLSRFVFAALLGAIAFLGLLLGLLLFSTAVLAESGHPQQSDTDHSCKKLLHNISIWACSRHARHY